MNAVSGHLIGCALAFAVLGGDSSTGLITADGTQSAKIVSPQVGSDRRVTFRVYAPTATKVEVVQFAASPSQGVRGTAVTLPMTREGDVWTATSAALTPDIYSYKFSIDGKVVNDPANGAVIEELLSNSSKVAVPGALWTDTGAPAGTVARQRYASSIAGGEVEYLVYTPPGYDASRGEPYPAVYLLHGLGDSAASWVTNGGVDLTLNNLIAQRRVKPLVVVMPQCHPPNRMGLNPAAFEKSLFDELIPRVEAEYHVSRDATTRALAGVSVGGAQAMSIGMRRTDMFKSIGLFSVSVGTMAWTAGMPDPRQLQLDLSPLRVVFVGSGTEEQVITDTSRALGQSLQAKGIRVVTAEVKGQGHVWPVWRQLFGDFVQTLFQQPLGGPAR
jgi:enterochelin esterase-like enzyme